MSRLTTKQVSEELGVCVQRITAKLAHGDFPNHSFCECGRSIMIPRQDVLNDMLKKKRRKSKK